MKHECKSARRRSTSIFSTRLYTTAIAFVLAGFGSWMGCSGDVHDNRTSSTSGSASSSGIGGMAGAGGEMAGSGGMGGSAGMGGSGGAIDPTDGGTENVVYSASNLFTHVPRFMVFKADHSRNVCVRLWVEGFSGGGTINVDVTSPWAINNVEITNDVNDCTLTNGFPAPAQSSANATAGTGTMVIEGAFPCGVTVHASFSFDPQAPWIPQTEAFDVDALPVDGGCG